MHDELLRRPRRIRPRMYCIPGPQQRPSRAPATAHNPPYPSSVLRAFARAAACACATTYAILCGGGCCNRALSSSASCVGGEKTDVAAAGGKTAARERTRFAGGSAGGAFKAARGCVSGSSLRWRSWAHRAVPRHRRDMHCPIIPMLITPSPPLPSTSPVHPLTHRTQHHAPVRARGVDGKRARDVEDEAHAVGGWAAGEEGEGVCSRAAGGRSGRRDECGGGWGTVRIWAMGWTGGIQACGSAARRVRMMGWTGRAGGMRAMGRTRVVGRVVRSGTRGVGA
ncbi:hypothetical protein HYPSUDRAFT_954875 [Hypholoma sublateritium FD-334 SS-4]|uniref:Uncharacterized protein n=1 Tax=Hypholoma sublateritium (strain FD-334 SS-4) TaxID=945553 RepID=A0A0D2PE72_HYPSF|nr:hypothetical protein HYPSUDRAFT_954875 [Hypholoma sublateritium FD-334 SS-4]